MKKEKDMLDDAIQNGTADCDLRLDEIPNLDLYIDQILTLVSAKNQSAAERYHDNVLTNTMINNYSKEGLLMPVKGKKYTKEHIVQMLLIYSLKSSLSIGDIHRVLEGARSEGVNGNELMESYERHLESKEQVRRRVAKSVKGICGEGLLEDRNGSDFLVSLLDLLSYSAYIRNVALELLETRYPAVADDKEKEKKNDKKDKDKEKKVSDGKASEASPEGENDK